LGTRQAWHAACHARSSRIHLETRMGKYLLAWLLGVPAFVLVLFYLFFH
jgi:hypothetical protein